MVALAPHTRLGLSSLRAVASGSVLRAPIDNDNRVTLMRARAGLALAQPKGVKNPESKHCYIYRITCSHCQRVYIGSAYDVTTRFKQHKYASKRGTSKLYTHIRYILNANEIRQRFNEPEYELRCDTILETNVQRRFSDESLMIHRYRAILCGLNTAKPKIDHTTRMLRLRRLLND